MIEGLSENQLQNIFRERRNRINFECLMFSGHVEN